MVLRGHLAPDCAIIEPAACDPKFDVRTKPVRAAGSGAEVEAIVDDPTNR